MSRDRFAASHLRSLRLDRGLSPERLGWAVGVSGHTIRRIERHGAIPTPRVQYALAQFFELRPTELWPVEPRRAVAA